MAILGSALALPSTPGYKRFSLKRRKVAGVSENPFTLAQQVQEWSGERWEVGITLPPMVRANGAEWEAMLTQLRGKAGTFMLRLPLALRTPRGTALGAPKVDGAHAAGSKVLSTKGWNANQTAVMKAADYIQVGNYLHQVLGAEASDGSGKASFDIFPSTREALSADLPLTVSSPQGIFRLANNEFLCEIDGNLIYSIAFDAVEAL